MWSFNTPGQQLLWYSSVIAHQFMKKNCVMQHDRLHLHCLLRAHNSCVLSAVASLRGHKRLFLLLVLCHAPLYKDDKFYSLARPRLPKSRLSHIYSHSVLARNLTFVKLRTDLDHAWLMEQPEVNEPCVHLHHTTTNLSCMGQEKCK